MAIAELSERYKNVSNYVFVDYKGLNASQATEFRNQLHKTGLRMNIIKNSNAQVAFEKLGQKELVQFLDGPTAVIFPEKDVESVTLAKEVVTWRTKNKVLKIKGGYLEGRISSAEEVNLLARIPSRAALLGQLAGVFNAPLTNLARALKGTMQKMAVGLQAFVDKQAKEAPAEKKE